MKQYSHLFFDLDNTLWDFTTNSYHALNKTFEKLKIDLNSHSFDDFFSVYKKINKQFWADYREKRITKEELNKKRFEFSLSVLGINAPYSGNQISEQYLQFMPQQTVLFKGAIETLELLKGKGYILSIITNGFKEVQREKLKTSGLDKYFESVFISEEIEAPKPNRKIFEHALSSCNALKKKSLMIGDSWEVDIMGAAKSGIDQVWFVPQEKCFAEALREKCFANYYSRHLETGNLKTKTFLIGTIPQLLTFLL